MCLVSIVLTGCGSKQDNDITLCKKRCEQSVNAEQREFCLSACEKAKEYSEKMNNVTSEGDVPVDEIMEDFDEKIYGNMNEQQKAKMKAMQETGQIPSDLRPPENPEDWEPNEDNLDDTNECAGAFCD